MVRYVSFYWSIPHCATPKMATSPPPPPTPLESELIQRPALMHLGHGHHVQPPRSTRQSYSAYPMSPPVQVLTYPIVLCDTHSCAQAGWRLVERYGQAKICHDSPSYTAYSTYNIFGYLYIIHKPHAFYGTGGALVYGLSENMSPSSFT